MAFRTFKVTLPADTVVHNLYSLLVGTVSSTNPRGYGAAQGGTDETAITGAIPTDGILADRVAYLEIQADSGNTGTLTINDRNNANTTGKVLNAADTFEERSDKNTICLKDYFPQGSVNSQKFELRMRDA